MRQIGCSEGSARRRLASRVRHQHCYPVLREVPVEEGGGDAETLHHREAGGIGEREVLVLILADDRPCPRFVLNRDALNRGRAVLDLEKDSGRDDAIESSQE
jgi:hypothetical protein